MSNLENQKNIVANLEREIDLYHRKIKEMDEVTIPGIYKEYSGLLKSLNNIEFKFHQEFDKLQSAIERTGGNEYQDVGVHNMNA